MKRRLSVNDEDEDDDASFSSDFVSSSTFSTSRQKRVRYNSLERTLAHMTLGGVLSVPSEDVDMWPKTSLPCPGVQGTLNIILPSSVEEPDTPTSEHVDMEVEPTLVTTDASATAVPSPNAIDDWESVESGQLDIKEVQISSAVLECLRRQTKCLPPLIPLASSQALVLYRPPRPPSPKPLDHKEEKPTQRSIVVSHEDALMEVE